MKTIQGDLIKLAKEGYFDVIVHGCNCMCKMGAGIAKQIKKNFPEAYEADRVTEKGLKEKLGTCSVANCKIETGHLIVVNAYTQFDYRGRGEKINYNALEKCIRWILNKYSGMKVGMPRIGTGLGGGDWEKIEKTIKDADTNENVTVVTLRYDSRIKGL